MQKRSLETRMRILQTALALFSRSGYDAASVADICAAAGVSKGAFYFHFPSKQAVFITLLDEWLALIDAGFAAVREGSQTVPDALLKMTELTVEVLRQAGGRLPMFLEFWSRASHDAEIWKATIAPYHRYQLYFTELIREGIREGSFKPVDPETAAKLIVSLAVGMLLQGVVDPDGADWPQEIQKSMFLILDGLRKE